MMKQQLRIRLLILCAAVTFAAALLSVAVFGAFSDVHSSDYYSEPVAWAVKNHITDGVSATRFAPNEACTRAQIVGFLDNLSADFDNGKFFVHCSTVALTVHAHGTFIKLWFE